MAPSLTFWSSLSALVIFIAGLKGISDYKASFHKEAVVGWERGPWLPKSNAASSSVHPLVARIAECNRKMSVSRQLRTCFLCLLQKCKLLLVYYCFRLVGGIWWCLTNFLPGYGGIFIPLIWDLVLVGGFIAYQKPSLYKVLNFLKLRKSGSASNNEEQSIEEKNEVVEMDVVAADAVGQRSPLETWLPGVPLANDAFNQNASNGLRCRDLGSSSSGYNTGDSETSGDNEAFVGIGSGSDVDSKLKKEVRFCGESFCGTRVADQDLQCGRNPDNAAQRRTSPVKKISLESASKNGPPKVTCSIPSFIGGPRF